MVFAEIVVEEIDWNNPFKDVSEDDEYYDAVRFVYETGLFKGVSSYEFAPDVTMTRAMFVTVLGRLDNIDTSLYKTVSFDDVVAGSWYAPYVEWAANNGIVLGYGDGSFGIEDEITVEQAVVILARYAKYIGIYGTADTTLDGFADGAEVCDWAVEDMKWAVYNEIYMGMDGKLNPESLASRALVAMMLYNFA